MKLRIRGDSVRLRLTRSEVDALVEKGRIEETTAFGSGVLGYAIAFGGTTLAASFDGGKIEITIPGEVARAWASGDAVGVEAVQPAEGGRALKLLVEKDWTCLKPREGEDDSDAFPHPKAP